MGSRYTSSEITSGSLRPLQVEVRVHRLVLHHERPIFHMMVGVDEGKRGMVHVVVRTAADVLELELDHLAIGRHLAGHARPVPRIAIVNQRELVSIHVKHRDWMVVLCCIEGRSCFLKLVH